MEKASKVFKIAFNKNALTEVSNSPKDMIAASKSYVIKNCHIPVPRLNGSSLAPSTMEETAELSDLCSKLRSIIPSCQQTATSDTEVVINAVNYIRELHLLLRETSLETQRSVP
ncbi:uncharacterized protein LOC143450194 [Clavelina lepadiformis]|uniref:uncharacterized protein LOC143450194 n=1 Tax=Clavelina lepadiformis TaxID=159417 RepID=UPI004040F410